MSQGDVIAIGKDAVLTALMIAAPFLGTSLIIGLVISVFQAAAQVHEQNIVFVPKIVATALILIILGSWIITIITDFTITLFETINTFL